MTLYTKKNIFLSVGFIVVFLTIIISTPAHSFEHPAYLIKAKIDNNEKTISAFQTVTFTNNSKEDIYELYFHIYPNRKFTEKEKEIYLRYAGLFKINPYPDGFKPHEFTIQSVTSKSKQLNYFIEGEDETLLKISLDEALNPGESIKVSIDFTLELMQSYGRLGWHNNIIALSRWYPILSVYDENGWNKSPYYPFHRPFYSDAATYDIELEVDQNQVVVHSGLLEKEEKRNVHKKTLFIKSKIPIRDFAVAMSSDYKVYEKAFDKITIKSFYLSGNREHAQRALESAHDMMKYYTDKFIPYPYEVFNIVPVYLGYGGEQMSNMMFVDTRAYQLPGILDRYFDFLIAHEAGHQWFYNIIGIDEFNEMWLEEGVTSYFLSNYLEEKYGKDGKFFVFPQWAQGAYKFLPEFTFRRARESRYQMLTRIGYDNPTVGKLSSFREPSSIFATTYGKGSRVISMLRDILGEEKFDNVFERIFQEYQFRNIKVRDFISICNEEYGKDLGWFFKQWLYEIKFLDIAVNKVKDHEIWISHKGGIIMPAEVKIEYDDGSYRIVNWDQRIDGNKISDDGLKPIKRVHVDPEQKLLELDRTNNTWPRHINVKVIPLYHGLFDIPALMPDESYNLILGPEFENSGVGVKASFQKPFDQNFYVATDWEFGEDIIHSRVGYQISNLFKSQTALGFEISNRTDHDDGEEDLVSGKVFLRRELWPVQYGLSDVNDHITLYVIRNQSLNKSLLFGGSENNRNVSYLRASEAIVGSKVHFERSSSYPDPNRGYRIDALIENSGHFLGATQHFQRAEIDTSFYKSVTKQSKIALRLKYGWGQPNDKNLFQLGGINGLRGYDRKDIRGANALLGSVEFRFPIKKFHNAGFLDNIFSLDSLSGVGFFDAGQSWFSDFDESTLKKNAGFGLRTAVNIGSYFEKIILRADVAWAINDSAEDDPHFWFGVGHAF